MMNINSIVKTINIRDGYVYLLRYSFNDLEYFKIGYTKQTVEKRVQNIIRESIAKYSVDLKVEIVDYFSHQQPKVVEYLIHTNFKGKASVDKIIPGYTELYHTNPKRKVLEQFTELKEKLLIH